MERIAGEGEGKKTADNGGERKETAAAAGK